MPERPVDLVNLSISLTTMGAAAFWLMTVPGSPAWRVFGLLTGVGNLVWAARRLWWVRRG